ncbi:MAG: cytidine deaminase [Bacillota bacterium]
MEPGELVTLAREALPRAYAPYSGYRVAAALLTEKGEVFTGVNVENSSLGLTVCAERAAVAAAVTAGHRQFSRLAVVAEGDAPPLPCGACRQVLSEFAPDLQIFVASRDEEMQKFTLQELLPHSFSFRKK